MTVRTGAAPDRPETHKVRDDRWHSSYRQQPILRSHMTSWRSQWNMIKKNYTFRGILCCVHNLLLRPFWLVPLWRSALGSDCGYDTMWRLFKIHLIIFYRELNRSVDYFLFEGNKYISVLRNFHIAIIVVCIRPTTHLKNCTQ